MAGNVWEWTESTDLVHPEDVVLCGGGWRTLYHINDSRLPNYAYGDCFAVHPRLATSDIGFRCAAPAMTLHSP